MNCTVTKAVKERFFGVGLNGSLYHFIYGLVKNQGATTTVPPGQLKLDGSFSV